MVLRGINPLPGHTLEPKENTHQPTRNAAAQPVVTCEEASSLVGYDPLTRNLYRLQKPAISTSDDIGRVVVSYKGLPGHQNTEYKFQPIILCFLELTHSRAKNEHSTFIPQSFFQNLALFFHIITIYPVFLVPLVLPCAILRPLSTIIPPAVSAFFSYMFPKRRRLKRLRSHPMWKLLISYFPIRLYRSTELPVTKKYIFGCHPHGILSYGVFTSFATDVLGFNELFPGIKTTLLTLDSNFRIPVFRDYLLAMGFGSAAQESIKEILTKNGNDDKGRGQAVAIIPGGAKESLEAIPGTFRTVIKNRKGFIRLAILTGADIVPVIAFGENDLYDTVDLHTKPMLLKVQLLFKKLFGFTIPFFYTKGPYRFDLGIMPHRRPVNVVIGRPIETSKIQDSFEADDIDDIHERYMQELQRMWDEWKDVFAPNRREGLTFL